MVALLERALELAKAGSFDQLVVCGLGETQYDGMLVFPDNRGWMMHGYLGALQDEIIQRVNENLEVPE